MLVVRVPTKDPVGCFWHGSAKKLTGRGNSDVVALKEMRHSLSRYHSAGYIGRAVVDAKLKELPRIPVLHALSWLLDDLPEILEDIHDLVGFQVLNDLAKGRDEAEQHRWCDKPLAKDPVHLECNRVLLAPAPVLQISQGMDSEQPPVGGSGSIITVDTTVYDPHFAFESRYTR